MLRFGDRMLKVWPKRNWRFVGELIQGFLSMHPSNERTSAEGNIETPLEEHSF